MGHPILPEIRAPIHVRNRGLDRSTMIAQTHEVVVGGRKRVALGLSLGVAIVSSACLGEKREPTSDATSDAMGTSADTSADEGTAAAVTSGSDASSEGSGATDTGAAVPEICDGSDALRLVARDGAPEGACPGGGLSLTLLFGMLGRPALYVRGDCRYWVIAAAEPGAVRTGVLDDTQATKLAQDIGYAQWAELHGRYGSDLDCHRTLSSLRSTIECGGTCYWGDWAPPEIAMWLDAARSWQAMLYETGDPIPLTDALHLDGWILEAEPSWPVDDIMEWPFAFTPEEVGVPPYVRAPQPTWLVTDPDITTALRSYWLGLEQPAQDDVTPLRFRLPGDPVRLVELWLRDTVPFENEEGYIPIPEPPKIPRPD